MMEFKKASVLSPKRSIFAVKPLVKDSVIDIDKQDVNNPLAVVEYVEDICKFYKLAENSISSQLELTPEVLFLAIHILDRYLAMNLVARKEFPLVGLTALLIAAKYEKASTPVEKYVILADGVYSKKKEILDMEKSILGKLGCGLAVPTTYHFLVRFIKAAEADREMEDTMLCLAVSSLMQYAVIKSYSPSMIAASSVYAANCILEKTTL
ncbi:hypothetical protein MKX01_026889 [Papaver californicum]|nr:hypothetical protein MKX01_026889 [Papaver californicum]